MQFLASLKHLVVSLLALMTVSDKLIKLASRRNDLLAGGLSCLNLLDQRFRDVFRGSVKDLGHSIFQAWALLVHLLQNLETFKDDIKVCLLFKSPFSEFEDENDLLLVVRHILHRSELLLQRLQVLIEPLSFGADCAASTSSRGLSR